MSIILVIFSVILEIKIKSFLNSKEVEKSVRFDYRLSLNIGYDILNEYKERGKI